MGLPPRAVWLFMFALSIRRSSSFALHLTPYLYNKEIRNYDLVSFGIALFRSRFSLACDERKASTTVCSLHIFSKESLGWKCAIRLRALAA